MITTKIGFEANETQCRKIKEEYFLIAVDKEGFHENIGIPLFMGEVKKNQSSDSTYKFVGKTVAFSYNTNEYFFLKNEEELASFKKDPDLLNYIKSHFKKTKNDKEKALISSFEKLLEHYLYYKPEHFSKLKHETYVTFNKGECAFNERTVLDLLTPRRTFLERIYSPNIFSPNKKDFVDGLKIEDVEGKKSKESIKSIFAPNFIKSVNKDIKSHFPEGHFKYSFNDNNREQFPNSLYSQWSYNFSDLKENKKVQGIEQDFRENAKKISLEDKLIMDLVNEIFIPYKKKETYTFGIEIETSNNGGVDLLDAGIQGGLIALRDGSINGHELASFIIKTPEELISLADYLKRAKLTSDVNCSLHVNIGKQGAFTVDEMARVWEAFRRCQDFLTDTFCPYKKTGNYLMQKARQRVHAFELSKKPKDTAWKDFFMSTYNLDKEMVPTDLSTEKWNRKGRYLSLNGKYAFQQNGRLEFRLWPPAVTAETVLAYTLLSTLVLRLAFSEKLNEDQKKQKIELEDLLSKIVDKDVYKEMVIFASRANAVLENQMFSAGNRETEFFVVNVK